MRFLKRQKHAPCARPTASSANALFDVCAEPIWPITSRAENRTLIAVPPREVESANAFRWFRALEHFRIAQRINNIVVPGVPVLFHGETGKFIILHDTLILSCVIDQVDDIADFVISLCLQCSYVVSLAYFVRKLLDEIGNSQAKLLRLFVVICRCPGAAGKLNFLLTHLSLGQIARQLAARAPEIDLEGQRILPW